MSYEGLKFYWSPDYVVQPQIITVVDIETNLIPISLTENEISLMSFYDELGRQAVSLVQNEGNCQGRSG